MEENFFDNELVQRFEQMIEYNEEYYFDTEELEEIIIYYLEIGDISFAEIAVKYALKIHPQSLDIKTKNLEVLLEFQNYTEAKKIIDELKESSIENMDFLVCCAKYYSNLGNPKRSIEYCKKALEYGEEENFLNNFIADEYINLDEPFLALKYYKRALNADPYDDYALENIMDCFSNLKKSEEALEFINNYLDAFPFSETAWFEYGQYFFVKKNYEEAIKGFDYLLAINPSVMTAYTHKATCYEILKDYHKAIQVYEEILEMEYTKAYTYYRIGLCYKQLGERVQALQSFRKSLVEDPQFYLSMMEKSYIYEDLGDKYQALKYAQEAVFLNESNLDYQKRLAFLYIDMGKVAQSLECLKKITNAEPDRFYNWYAYAEALMLLQQYEDAVIVLNTALYHHKQRAELYYQLSNAYFYIGNINLAKEVLKVAQSLNPDLISDMQKKYPFIKNEYKKEKEKNKDEN